MVTDPIGDFITQLKNAADVGKRQVTLPYSKMKEAVAMTLKKCGYLGEVEKSKEVVGRTLTVELMYDAKGEPRIQGVKRISKPGRRLYAKVADIHPIRYGKGVMIISTPRGILSDAEARKLKAGGETLFAMW